MLRNRTANQQSLSNACLLVFVVAFGADPEPLNNLVERTTQIIPKSIGILAKILPSLFAMLAQLRKLRSSSRTLLNNTGELVAHFLPQFGARLLGSGSHLLKLLIPLF